MTDGEAQRLMMQDEDYLEYLSTDLLVPHYMIHCYLYYELGSAIISDHVFDALAKRLYNEWENARHHHRELIDKEALLSGGNYLKYPLRVQKSAESLWR